MKSNKIEIIIIAILLLFIALVPQCIITFEPSFKSTISNEDGTNSPCEISHDVTDPVNISIDTEHNSVQLNGSDVLFEGAVGYITTDVCESWYFSENGNITDIYLWILDENSENHTFIGYKYANFSVHHNQMDVRITDKYDVQHEFKSNFEWIAYSSNEGDYVSTFLSSPEWRYEFYVESLDVLYACTNTSGTYYSLESGNITCGTDIYQSTSLHLEDTLYDGVKKFEYVRDMGISAHNSKSEINIEPFILIMPHTYETTKIFDASTSHLIPIYVSAIILCSSIILLIRVRGEK